MPNINVPLILNDSKESCYWIGYLLTCCSLQDRSAVINVGLAKDRHIRLFVDKLDCSFKKNTIEKKIKDKFYYSIRIDVTNKTFISALKDMGFAEKKSDTFEPPPNLFSDLYKTASFFRGYFDGRGKIHTKKDGLKETVILSMSFTSGKFSEIVKDKLEKTLNVSSCLYEKRRKPSQSTKILEFSGEDAIKVSEFLYNAKTLSLEFGDRNKLESLGLE